MQPDQLRALFSESVKARRKELGLTQEQLAGKLGVKQPSVAAIESNRETRSPSLSLVARFAEALNTSPSALLSTDPTFSPIPS
jgi:transcriptional regulator with XRE-family HTH domain